MANDDKVVARTIEEPTPFKPEGSLTQQWNIVERAKHEMRNRIITGRAKLETEAHQRHQDIETQYQKDLLELKRKHDEAIRDLTDDIKERMQEFDTIELALDG